MIMGKDCPYLKSKRTRKGCCRLSSLKILPPDVELETKIVLKQLTMAHRALSELKGYANMIPNKNILINAVLINEAKDSSEIENIITTHDELFKAITVESYKSPAAKEVVNYRTALWHGYNLVSGKGLITTNMLTEIQQLIILNQAGIRKQPGTVLLNEATGEVVYTPPGSEEEILTLLANLETYINGDDDTDPLVKLAVIHYQFEAIHPFYDGNGRTGRILNILYLVLKGLLDSPILYLSKYIIRNKSDYYRLLSEVTKTGHWEEWILYVIGGIEETAAETLNLVKNIDAFINKTADEIKHALPELYSRELVDLLFFEFYTKNSYLVDGLEISRRTAYTYLSKLIEKGFLKEKKVGKAKIYFNEGLFELVKEFGTN
jgi:Fic family protein